MKSWCKEFAERQKVEIDLKTDVSRVLPFAVGLSLFRVLQEALNNAIKHSGVKRIEVQLGEDSGEIYLVINDSGRAFDVEAALRGEGPSLTSMRERVRLVNGTISNESKPMDGTSTGDFEAIRILRQLKGPPLRSGRETAHSMQVALEHNRRFPRCHKLLKLAEKRDGIFRPSSP